jgi:hypothetical protein
LASEAPDAQPVTVNWFTKLREFVQRSNGTHVNVSTQPVAPATIDQIGEAGQPRDRGMSLLEVLVATVLIGTTGVAVLTGLATAIRSSVVNDRIAVEQAWLSSAGDLLVGPETPYGQCATALADYGAALAARAGDAWPTMSIRVSAVEALRPNGRFAKCTSGDAVSSALQRITLVIDAEGSAGRSLQVIKSGTTS